MSRPDYDSEIGYAYVSQMRILEKYGDPNKAIRHRGAINNEEREIAKEVRRYIDRRVIGGDVAIQEVLPVDIGQYAICIDCQQIFSVDNMRLIRRIWYNSTSTTSQYKCISCYGGVHG